MSVAIYIPVYIYISGHHDEVLGISHFGPIAPQAAPLGDPQAHPGGTRSWHGMDFLLKKSNPTMRLCHAFHGEITVVPAHSGCPQGSIQSIRSGVFSHNSRARPRVPRQMTAELILTASEWQYLRPCEVTCFTRYRLRPGPLEYDVKFSAQSATRTLGS